MSNGLILENGKRATMEQLYDCLADEKMLLDALAVMTVEELIDFIEIIEYRIKHDDTYHPVFEYLGLVKDVQRGRETKGLK